MMRERKMRESKVAAHSVNRYNAGKPEFRLIGKESTMRIVTSVFSILLMASAYACAQGDIPTDWIDPDTGHRVIRLSREDGSQSSYFHQNEFTPDGRKLVFTSPSGLYTVDLKTREI
jgi:hypothetical protein